METQAGEGEGALQRHFRNFLRGMETLVGQGADLRRLVLPKLP